MEISEIDYYQTTSFWNDEEMIAFSSGELDISSSILPTGSLLFKTSGSSGSNKWVVHTRETILSSAKLVTNHLAVDANDRWLLALPIHHVGGFGILARSYYSGCEVIPFIGKWKATAAVSIIHRENVSLCSFVPTQVVDIVRAKLVCPKSVRAVIVGGGSLNEEIKLSAINLGWPILESYGMTETGSQIATQRTSDQNGLFVIDGWAVRVDNRNILQVKGSGLMKGYLLENEGQFEYIRPFDKDGWFKTSDRVELDRGSSLLKFICRSDRLVKILGELVDLDHLEHDLHEATGIEILIVDISDKRRGAFLVPTIEKNYHAELNSDLLALSGLLRLEPLVICDSFPRNAMGKLDRSSLRELVVKLREEA